MEDWPIIAFFACLLVPAFFAAGCLYLSGGEDIDIGAWLKARRALRRCQTITELHEAQGKGRRAMSDYRAGAWMDPD